MRFSLPLLSEAARTFSVLLGLIGATTIGCAGPRYHQKGNNIVVADEGNTVIITKQGDNCVIEAADTKTGAKAVIVAQPNGTCTISATSTEGRAVIDVNKDGTQTISTTTAPAPKAQE